MNKSVNSATPNYEILTATAIFGDKVVSDVMGKNVIGLL